MDLFSVERVKLGCPDGVGDAGAEFVQAVEIDLPITNCGVAGLEPFELFADKDEEIVVGVNSTHDGRLHPTGGKHKEAG